MYPTDSKAAAIFIAIINLLIIFFKGVLNILFCPQPKYI